jgi:hypothetical protein
MELTTYLLDTLLFITTLSDTLGQTAPDTTNHKDIAVNTKISPAARWYVKKRSAWLVAIRTLKMASNLWGGKHYLISFPFLPLE